MATDRISTERVQVESVQNWVQSFAEPLPIRAVHSSPYESVIREFLENHPFIHDSCAEALLWLRLGLIDRAHEIVQDASRGLPAYIHGMIHRLEGDYWNANYWFNRSQDALSDEILARIHCTNGKKFSATGFTKAVEKHFLQSQRSSSGEAMGSPVAELQETALSEWNAVWSSLS